MCCSCQRVGLLIFLTYAIIIAAVPLGGPITAVVLVVAPSLYYYQERSLAVYFDYGKNMLLVCVIQYVVVADIILLWGWYE